MTINQSKSNIGGKADSLLKLKSVQGIHVPSFTVIPTDSSNALSIIKKYLNTNPQVKLVAVRSSALVEDGELASFAGAFDTFLNVDASIESVLESVNLIRTNATDKLSNLSHYMSHRKVSPQDGVGIVVQEMVNNPDFSGVVFSHSLEQVDAYLQINYHQGLGEDLVSGRTAGGCIKVLRDAPISDKLHSQYPFLRELLNAIYSIEQEYSCKSMDIEFAFKDDHVFILQARPMTVVKGEIATLDIQNLQHQVTALNLAVTSLTQDDFLGDMIDINPRELLGDFPSPLNISIFGKIFADSVVESVRESMGYAPLHRGMIKIIAGKPYVSLRSSAYSMRPAQISSVVYEKIFQYYLTKIRADHDLQDKVEFQLFALTAQQAGALTHILEGVLTPEEQVEMVQGFTLLDEHMHTYMEDYISTHSNWMEQYRSEIHALSNSKGFEINAVVSLLIKGTSYFTATARLAFYAKSVVENELGADVYEQSVNGLKTISSQLQHDLFLYAKGGVSLDYLTQTYGHLRVGQMNVFAPSYKDDPTYYFNLNYYGSMSHDQANKLIEEANARHGEGLSLIDTQPSNSQLKIHNMRFLLQARESVKFEFNRAYDLLSEALLDIGRRLNLDSSLLALLDINDIITFESSNSPVVDNFLPEKPPHGGLKLPSVLTNTTDLNCIKLESKFGTFFSRKVVEAPVVIVKAGDSLERSDVEGRIIVLDHADPGFDFLLSYGLAGLITKVGGPASHMAIRLSEYGLPGCIGSGIDLDTIDLNKSIVLDCKNKRISEGRELS